MTTQFSCALDGTKCQPMIIYKASSAMFPEDGKLPRTGTVARELRDREMDGVKYPAGVILACNPKAYAKEEELNRTFQEQLKELPLPLIVNCDDYTEFTHDI